MARPTCLSTSVVNRSTKGCLEGTPTVGKLNYPVDLTLLGGIAHPLLAYKPCREGIAMYDSARLGGQVILVVEGEAGPFPLELQAALERVGAETLLARCPARARDLASRFDLSAAA